MKKLLSILFICISCTAFSQSVKPDTLIVNSNQLDSQLINGKWYYSIKTGTTTKEKNDILKALTDAATAATINKQQDSAIGDVKLTADNALAMSGFANSTNNQQTKSIDSLRKRIKDLENAPASGSGTSLHKTIEGATYTITDADDNYTIAFTNSKTITIIVPVLSRPINVRLLRKLGVIVVSPVPSVSLTGTVANSVPYRRISAGGYADINYDSTTSAQLTGNLTK